MEYLALTMLVPEERAPEIAAALSALARRVRHDQGCVHAHVFEAVDRPNHLSLRLDWADEPALARYIRSSDFTQVLTLADMAIEPPALEFRLGSTTRGLDYIAEVRTPA